MVERDHADPAGVFGREFVGAEVGVERHHEVGLDGVGDEAVVR